MLRRSLMGGAQPPVGGVIASQVKLMNPPRQQLWGVVIFIGLVVTVLVTTSLYLFFHRNPIFQFFRKRDLPPPLPVPANLKTGIKMVVEKKEEKSRRVTTLRKFEMEEIKKATNNFSSECLLGTGSFANVYKASFEDGNLPLQLQTFAIKRPHPDSYFTLEDFRNEVKLLSKVKHTNLLALVGYCEESGGKGEKLLVYEYVPNGTLLDYILGREGRSLSWRHRVKIAIGAAKGIAHLHNGLEPISIIHRDIKPSNILIAEDYEAKVSDFGLVRTGPMGDISHVSSQVKGTPGYLDPSYCSTFHLTPFSDVYSFGIILFQLLSARPVLDSSRPKPLTHIVDWVRPSLELGKVEDILDANLLLCDNTEECCSMEVMLKMGEIGLKCVSEIPKDRPTMTHVWQQLEETLLYYDTSKVLDKKMIPRRLDDSRKLLEEYEMDSQSFVSLEGMRLQKFHVEMDSVSFQSSSLRCFDNHSCISIDVEPNLLKTVILLGKEN